MAAPAPSIPAAAFRAWPRAVQLAAAFLIGLLTAYLAGRYTTFGGRSRPLDRERVVVAAPIDLNRAAKSELLQLPAVGERMADAILAARTERGGFQHVDELREVHGIGPTRLETLRPWVRVDAQSMPTGVEPVSIPKAKPTVPYSGGGKKELPPNTLIDVNRASADELQRLPGVGPVMARKIIAEREKSPFRGVEELRRVSGLGAKTLEKLRPYVTAGIVAAGQDAVAIQ